MDNAHILIVDDNPEIREIIQILLSGEGFLTEEAKDGKTALDLLQMCIRDRSIILPHYRYFALSLKSSS